MTPTACPDEDALFDVLAGDAPAEVRAHAEGCPACRQRVEGMQLGLTTLRTLYTHETLTHEGPHLPPDRPAQLGKYFIVGALGEGAQAVVYRGLHATLNKEVVVKLGKHPAAEGATDRASLVNEGKVLALLDHPHLAKVLDLDFHQGRPYLVMEYVEGVTLTDYAAAAKPGPRQSAGLVAKLARALAAAHQQGVVHHDVKPGNVLVDDDGRPVLIDFGLAWLRRCAGPGEPGPEETGAPGGTLAYMAPEHARGEVEKIGPPSDLFSLAGVLLFLLTGKPPFTGTDPFTVQQKAMRCELDDAGLDAPGIPRPLARLCRRALSADPAGRPASAEAFARELEKLAAPPKNRLALLAACAAAAAVAACLAWSFLGGTPALPPAPGVQSLVRLHQRTEQGKTLSYKTPPTPDYLLGGDLVDVRFEVPPGSEAALYWLGSEGRLLRRDPVASGEGKLGLLLRYPAEKLARVQGPPGTELVLALASRKGRPLPPSGEVERLLAGQGPLPPLRPDDPKLLLWRGGVEEGADRGIDEEVSTPMTQVRSRLETLRKELLGRCDWFWAVALPHR